MAALLNNQLNLLKENQSLKKEKKGIIRSLLHYARAVDPTMLMTINIIAAQQSQGTDETAQAINQLLNYSSTHPNVPIQFTASDMMLCCQSDASYLLVPKGRNRVAGYFYLGSETPHNQEPQPQPPANAPIHVECKALKNVVASAAEAEFAALFENCKIVINLRNTLTGLGYTQQSTAIVTDNSTAWAIANNKIKKQKSNAIDMRYFWVQDRCHQNHAKSLPQLRRLLHQASLTGAS